MMLPIANAVLQQLCETEANAEERESSANDGQENQAFEMGDYKESNGKELKPKDNNIHMGVCLSVTLSIFLNLTFFLFKENTLFF